MTPSAPKFAAYACGGCGLAQRLDLGRLASVAQKEGKMNLVRSHEFLCSKEGVSMIADDIASEGVSRVVIAACSRRAKTEAFDFPGVATVRANLREGVIWSQPETDAAREATQEMAEDYLRMACAEVKKVRMPQGHSETKLLRKLLVVGGGLSGLTTAIEAAEAGYGVVVVEKRSTPGGNAGALWKRVPAREPYDAPIATGIPELVARATAHPLIEIHLNATIAETRGAPGRFQVSIAHDGGGMQTVEVGAIVQATGFTGYDIAKLPELGGGRIASVIDAAAFESAARAQLGAGGALIRPSDGAPVRSVAFVQCAGQCDTSGKHLPYCSGHCCATSVKQAMYLKQADAGIDAVVLYSDLRIPGQAEDFYRSAQRNGVIFTKAAVTGVEADGGGCAVTFKDLILDEEVRRTFD
ncbi:MAG: CoB--CoM heterodisulfide reductase iron-sulfur subunit A family protein, partial [Bacillota bacterium]